MEYNDDNTWLENYIEYIEYTTDDNVSILSCPYEMSQKLLDSTHIYDDKMLSKWITSNSFDITFDVDHEMIKELLVRAVHGEVY